MLTIYGVSIILCFIKIFALNFHFLTMKFFETFTIYSKTFHDIIHLGKKRRSNKTLKILSIGILDRKENVLKSYIEQVFGYFKLKKSIFHCIKQLL